MEGSADRKYYRALGALLFRKFGSALDCSLAPGDDNLVGRIDVRGLADLSLCGFVADFAHAIDLHPKNGSHGTFADWHGFLHVLAAIPHGANGVSKVQGPGGDVCR